MGALRCDTCGLLVAECAPLGADACDRRALGMADLTRGEASNPQHPANGGDGNDADELIAWRETPAGQADELRRLANWQRYAGDTEAADYCEAMADKLNPLCPGGCGCIYEGPGADCACPGDDAGDDCPGGCGLTVAECGGGDANYPCEQCGQPVGAAALCGVYCGNCGPGGPYPIADDTPARVPAPVGFTECADCGQWPEYCRCN